MSLHYRLYSLPCTFCGRPVHRIDACANGVRTVHQGHNPPCVYIREPRTGAVEPSSGLPRRAPAPVRSHRGAARPWIGRLVWTS